MRQSDKLFILVVVIGILTGCVSTSKRPLTDKWDTQAIQKIAQVDQSIYEPILQAHYLSLIGLASEAMAIFDSLITKFPENSDLTFQYAKFYLDLALRAQEAETGIQMLTLSKKAFLKTIELDPTHFEAQKTLATIYLETEEFSKATMILEKLVDMNPKDSSIRIELARLYIHEQKAEKAVDLLKSQLDDDTIPNPDVLKVFALANAELNRLQDAIPIYERYLELSPDDFEAMFNLALCYYRVDRYEEAEKILVLLQQTKGLSIETLNLYVDVLVARGKFYAAIELLQAVAKDARIEISALLRIGDIYLTMEKYESAEKCFLQVLAKEPDNRQAIFYTALALQLQDKCQESIAMIENNLKEKPILILSAELAIYCLMQLEETQKALHICDRLLDEKPDEFTSYLITAEVLEKIKQYDRMTQVLRKGADKFPDNSFLHLYLAIKLEEYGDWKEALEVAEKLLERAPDDPNAANFVGYILADRNLELDRALGLIEQALEQFPEESAYLDSLGWVLFRMGRLDEALETMKKAMELQSDDPTVIEHMIHIYRAMGDHQKALDLWEKAMNKFPDHQGLIETGAPFDTENQREINKP